jgi:hypothetical protein
MVEDSQHGTVIAVALTSQEPRASRSWSVAVSRNMWRSAGSSLTPAFQPRRPIIAPAADGCKRLLARVSPW